MQFILVPELSEFTNAPAVGQRSPENEDEYDNWENLFTRPKNTWHIYNELVKIFDSSLAICIIFG